VQYRRGFAAVVTWPQILRTLLAGSPLSSDEARWVFTEILEGRATDGQIAAFVASLRTRSETADEVGALVSVMLEHANTVSVDGVVLDVVGTGGDGLGTVNISTMAALVCAAAGAVVVKHGNRAASSKTGTADVLEELGVVIELSPQQVSASVAAVGIGFCFAPMHHPALRHAGPVRKELGVPTVFNILGPLANPAGAGAALIGCADMALARVMAQTLCDRGVRALVVRGENGLDEIAIDGITQVWDATGAAVITRTLDIRDLGIGVHDAALLVGGERDVNAALLRAALADEASVAPSASASDQLAAIRAAVAVNAAAALVAYDVACDGEPIASDADFLSRMQASLMRAEQVLASGSALALLDRWIEVTREL